MRLQGDSIPAVFRARLNRFLVEVELEDGVAQCFLPDPAPIKELLASGAQVYLLENPESNRKTRFDLVLLELEGMLISIDTRMPNKVVGEALDRGLISELKGLKVERCEPAYGDSRFDFLLADDYGKALVEVKSCSLVREGVALFPSVPTKRGCRQLEGLIDALKLGRSIVFFHVQRSDAFLLRPNEEVDPSFAASLRKAVDRGVEVYAYNSQVSLREVRLCSRIPVDLG